MQPNAPTAIGSKPTSADGVAMTFVGANRAATLVPQDRLPGVSNYFIGSDPHAWRTNVAQYGRVTYRDLYPGTDLTLYGNQGGRLEYDFIVRPGTDPSLIHLGFRGAHALDIDSTGDLVIRLAHTSLDQRKPQIYQVVDGTRTPISGGYALDRDQLSFAIGGFDRTRPLVIDPEVVYSTYLGGSVDEFSEEQPAVDSSGHVYICGITDSPDFPVTPGVVQPSFAGEADGFISELTPDGTDVVYSTYLGTSGFDDAVACAVDSSGNLYVLGITDSPDFPVTSGVVQPSLAGGVDGFIAKLSLGGSQLLYSTYVGGTGDDFTGVDDLAVDAAGEVVATGDTYSTDFPTTPGAYQTASAGCQGPCKKYPARDVVILKLNASGSTLIYSTYLGGPGDDAYPTLALDAAGDVYVAGLTLSLRFPTTPGALQPHFGGGRTDAFVAKLDPTGSSLIYATYLGGGGDDLPIGIAIDAAGDAYVGGFTCSPNLPVTRGAFQTENAGGRTLCWVVPGPSDGFVAELNPQGTGLGFSTYLGGSGIDVVGVAGVDSSGHVIVVGGTASTDFPVTADAFQRTPHHEGGAPIIAELSADGSELLFSTYWGGSDFDVIHGSVLDASDNLYVSGCTRSTDFPVTPGAFQTAFQGGSGNDNILCLGPDDAFVTKVAFGG